MSSPEGRQAAKGHVLWEQQGRGEVRQFTTFKKIMDLGRQGQAWGERRPVRPPALPFENSQANGTFPCDRIGGDEGKKGICMGLCGRAGADNGTDQTKAP